MSNIYFIDFYGIFVIISECRCAPECISYLKFTSASDVWAYGVTLWEMFSYGFQPWAALTGHQILEAIDEPNFQVFYMTVFFFVIRFLMAMFTTVLLTL